MEKNFFEKFDEEMRWDPLLSLEPWLLFQTYETQTSNDGITSKASTSTDITSTASIFKTANVDFPYDIKNPV